jgi:hypothetical protein
MGGTQSIRKLFHAKDRKGQGRHPMKKGTKAWLDFTHRDLEAARLLVDSEHVSNVVMFHSQQWKGTRHD